MAENNFSALVKLVVDKAQARSTLQRELKELQKDIELETGVKVNISDIKQARKEIAQANKEQQEGTRENIKLRAQELAHTKMLAKETKAATDLELSSRERVRKLNDQTFKEESSARRKAIQETKLQAQEQKALIESLNTSEKKINRKIKNESYDTNIDKIKKQFQDYGLTVDQAEEKVSVLRSTLSEMQTLSGDSLIKKADEWEKAFADVKVQLDKTKLAYEPLSEVNKIQLSLDTEKYSKDIKGINDELSKVGKFTLSDQSNEDIFKKANDSAKSLQSTYNQLKTVMADANATDQQKIDIENKYQQELTTTKNLLSQIKLSKDDERVTVGDPRRVNMIATFNSYLAKNTAMTRENKRQIEEWINILGSSDDMTVGAIKNINSEFKQLDASLRKTGKLGLSMWDKFKQAVEKFGGWSLVTGAMTKAWQGIHKVYDEAIKLDDVMTDLAMATDLTASEMESLVNKYSDLGEELNATVTDVIASGTEWIKQGQSIADTEKLITSAMVLDKIGKLESAGATKYLTSVMKGYQVAVEDTMGIVDKLSAVDMASATDVGGLAEGMSEVASSADLAGVSMDKLLGYLAAIGEVTQSGMSEVGTTLNAVFSRMGNIKLARLKDYETGEDLSNVETVLRGVQINLRDTNNSFRDFDEVLDETASGWDSFSDTQQRAVASAFAGTHHMNEFIVLMENYGKALEYTEVSMNSSGEAMEKFDDYQESVAAHTELFNKSLQDLANTAIDSGLVNFFIDLGTFGVKALEGILDTLTPLGTLLTGLGGVGVYQFVKNFD